MIRLSSDTVMEFIEIFTKIFRNEYELIDLHRTLDTETKLHTISFVYKIPNEDVQEE